MPLNHGDRFDSYQIECRLGVGGMGEVFKARDRELGRYVAIKVLPENSASDPQRVDRFKREARAASALNHPNIVTIHHVGVHSGSPYIAMEWVEGVTLRDRLRQGRLPNDQLLDYALQITKGLVKAHQRGIVHRDLKPENIMIRNDGLVKILDFGLAILFPHNSPGDAGASTAPFAGTDPGTVLGSMGYMSPEQLKAQLVDFRADQFSFGAILYEMATGDRAFPGGSPAETMSSILRDDPPEISSAVPRRLIRVISRCLEKLPDNRYSSTSELQDELTHAGDAPADDLGRKPASIAVLPLRDLNSAPDDLFFCGRDDRRADHRARENLFAQGHIPDFRHAVQGHHSIDFKHRSGAGRRRDHGRFGVPGGQPRPHQRTVDRSGNAAASLGR